MRPRLTYLLGRTLILSACLLIPGSTTGQQEYLHLPLPGASPRFQSQEEYDAMDLEAYAVERETWQKLSSELDAEEFREMPEQRTRRRERPAFNKTFTENSKVWKITLIVVVSLVLLFVLLRIGQMGLFRRNPRLPASWNEMPGEMNPDSPHEEIEEALESATRSGDFRLAIRLTFLLVLRELHGSGWIHWKRDKTNADYLRELPEAGIRSRFSILSDIYTWTWYGERPVSRPLFEKTSPLFNSFLRELNDKRK